MGYIPKPWEDFAKDLKRLNTRWRIQKRDDSPIISVRDVKKILTSRYLIQMKRIFKRL
jgi:hypothetical protein